MAKAIGIGGVFIHLNGDQKELFDWYETHLGLEFSAYGTGFIEGEQLMVLTLKRDHNPNNPYLNLRVDDIDTIITNLKQEKVVILSDVTSYDYGKFATFKDPFGNPIELWEPNDSEYKKMVRKEIEDYKQH